MGYFIVKRIFLEKKKKKMKSIQKTKKKDTNNGRKPDKKIFERKQ